MEKIEDDILRLRLFHSADGSYETIHLEEND